MRTQRRQYALISLFLLVVAALSGCSRGGSDQAADSPPLSASVNATVAASGELKLATAGTPSLIAGVDVTVILPAGVSVAADPTTGETAAGAVMISGVAADNSLLAAKYTPASGNAPATLHIVVINAAGFHPGEFATVRFNLAQGTSFPAVGAFVITNFSAKGPDSTPLSGIIAAPLLVAAVGNAAAKKVQVVVTAPPPDNYVTIMVDSPTRFSDQTISGTVDSRTTPTVIASTSQHTAAIVSAVTVTKGVWSAHISGLTEGTNVVTSYFTALDGSTAAVSAEIVVDTKSPDLTVNTILGTKNSFQSIGGTVDDPPYHIVTVEVKCDFATPDPAVVAVPYWNAMISNLYYGNNHCTVTATDQAGNHTSKDVYIYFDNIPPNLDIHVNAKVKYNTVQYVYGTVDSGVTPTVTTGTSSAVVSTVSVTGSNWSTYISGLQLGDNIITVTAEDLYGNITTKTATITTYVCNGSFSGAPQPTVADALKALRYAVGLDVPTVEDLLIGDLYDDGRNVIDLADAILILNKAVGLIDINVPNPYGL